MPSERRTLVIRIGNAGFFSNFNAVLNNLRYRLGRAGIEAAVVDWRVTGVPGHFSYARPEDGNAWHHFFEPLPFDSCPEATWVTRNFAQWRMTGDKAYGMYKLDRGWRQAYHRLYKRYIRIKPFIRERVEAIYRQRMAGQFCAGVHYRHPTHETECLHPIPSPEVFIARLRRLLPAGRAWAVVLASDYEPAVTAFKQAFGDRLVLQPGVRRASETEDHVHHDSTSPSLALAEQVLVDCLLLSRCDLLLHIASNVATAVGYINPRIKMVYCETLGQAIEGYFWSAFICKPRMDWVRTWLPRQFQRCVHQPEHQGG